MSESILVLVRHGQSEWNEKNLFTGWKNPDLTELGVKEAHNAGELIANEKIIFDIMFTSDLHRAQRTGNIILEEIQQEHIEIVKNQALNERDYGSLSGLNKDDAREKWGNDQVHIWRRSYDIPPPDGESLKNTGERVLPYFNDIVLPHLRAGKNVLIAAHGNSLRALCKYLFKINEREISKMEIPTANPLLIIFEDKLQISSVTYLDQERAKNLVAFSRNKISRNST